MKKHMSGRPSRDDVPAKRKDGFLDQGVLEKPEARASRIVRSGPERRPSAAPEPKSAIGEKRERIQRRRAFGRAIGRKLAIGFSVLIAAVSIYVLARTLAALDLDALRRAIAATGGDQIAAAAALTALSFLALTGYDALALRQLRARVAYLTTALASFTSYSVSFVLGFPLITAGTVRYWIYSQVGVSASKVASVTLIAGVTFWFGMIFVLAAGLTFRAESISAVNQFSPTINLLIGLSLFAGLLAYLAWASMRRRKVRLHGFRLQLPGFGVTLGQIALGVVDQCAAAGVLFVLLPAHSALDFPTFATTYVFACILGVASNAPGGIGVFEATMLKAVPGVAQEQMLASLLMFRAVYYIAPFILALALLGAHEATRRWKGLREAMERADAQGDEADDGAEAST
ncbi:lysylphosphatidylglycerol synthase domain-containing protein [Methylocella sp.]|uniref:lysylphosphatidylglycerol synthase domain-containing protein n=1 Tax=Methylocella sp. TaxID=1978226 RepID=UPI00378343FD